MGRSTRQDFEGGWHHVMNRGAARRQVFFTRSDGEAFERLLAKGCELVGAQVHAYCLMTNHFHLLLHLPQGGLSSFMHRVGTLYARRINDRLESDGPVFKSRFHSIVVDSASYLDRVGRYIHRNPIDLPHVGRLDAYRWSSYRCYVGKAGRPGWLTTDVLGDMHNGPSDYRMFVEGETESSVSCPGVLRWAIETALHELAPTDDVEPQWLDRVVATLMLDRASGARHTLLARQVTFPSPPAKRMAMMRARQRAAACPELLAVADRALELVA